MTLNSEISPQISAPALVMAALWLAIAPAVAETVPDQEPDQLVIAYQGWISALEAEGTNVHWLFPFDAPSPDGMSSRDLKTVLSLRRLARSTETDELATLAEIVARRQEEMPVQMRFWLAYSQGHLHQNEACWENLRLLLLVKGGPGHLETGQLAWVLTAFADTSFLLEKRDRAGQMYRQLAISSVEQVNLWGQYQLAGLEFLNRNFTEANRRYKVVCESEKSGTWHEHACAMEEIAGRLCRLDPGGGTHGRVATASP